MSSPPLTSKSIESARPAATDYELRDPAARGLVLRVSPKGAKVFRWRLRSIGRVITIGPFSPKPQPGHVSLAEARGWLERLKLAHRAGTLPQVEAELERALRPPPPPKPTEAGALTVRTLAAEFLRYVERGRRRPELVQRPIDFDILPAIGDKPIASVTPQDCRAIVEAVVARGSPTQAGVVLATLKQFFRFACDRDDLAASPAERFRNPRALGVEKNVSQRVLSDAEIAALWRGLDSYKGMTPTVRNGLKLLLLLGIRSGELLQATWAAVDTEAATLTIPVAHQKIAKSREHAARPWTVPLPPLALRLFEELRALAAAVGSPNVMASFHPAAKGEPISEKALNHAMRRLFTGKDLVLRFEGERPTPHDLRRSLRTGLARLGVPREVAERCLNHAVPGIEGVYNVHDALPERRDALPRWAAHVGKLVSAGPAQPKGAKRHLYM
jgi:integrase